MTGSPRGTKATVTQEMAFMAEGVSLSFLAVFFGMDKRHAAQKMVGVKVVSTCSRGYPRYDFKEAIFKLARPGPEQIVEYVKSMRPNDLPPMMQSEFWQGQLRRQKFMQDAGDLWHTMSVLDTLAEVFKSVRLSAMLMADSVARETDLTNRQREIITQMADTMLDDLRERLVANPVFESYRNQRAEMNDLFGEESPLEIFDDAATSLPDDSGDGEGLDGWVEAAGEAFG